MNLYKKNAVLYPFSHHFHIFFYFCAVVAFLKKEQKIKVKIRRSAKCWREMRWEGWEDTRAV